MTLLLSALALGAIFGSITPLHLDKECVAKREWRADWDWSDTSINVWVPKDSTELLNIRLGLNELHHADITFTRSSIVASVSKDLATDERGRSEDCPLEAGWRRVRLSLKADYELHLGDCNGTSPVSFPGDLLPELPTWVEVTGSNITVNCEMDLLAWRVSRTAVAVPLDHSEWHRISVYSVHEILPRFILENHKVELGLGSSGLSTLDFQRALPAFVLHNLSLACTLNSNYSSCAFTLGDSPEPERKVTLDKPPRHLLVQSPYMESGFYIFLHQDKSSRNIDVIRSGDSSHATVVAVTVVVTLLVLLAFAAMAYRNMLLDPKNSSMKDALLERDLGRARLLSEKRNEEDFQAVLVEACLVGREHFISCGETKADRSELIKDVLEAYTHLMDRVFMAAKKGKYRTEVDPLLRRYELPGSVRDEEGKSILHHIASVRTDDQRPMWTHVNIEHFMMTYNCIPNAVDYQGRTCLHLLAESAITSDKSVTWGEEEFTVTESWVCLGKLLLSLGCDPRRADNADRLPAHIARMNGNLRLFDVLSKKCEELRKDEQSTETKLVFDQILEAVYENNLQSLKKQCSLCTHLLPLESKIDPLTEAVRRGHLEAAMMLVAAGAPLCGLPLISVTPLHAAHSLPQLPIIIPVVLRKEYVNRLRYEAGSIQVISESKDEVKQKIETLARGVKSIGDKAMWRFAELRDGGKEARELLCKAADLGLSLTCQMLALEGVNIHPLPREPHPVQQAFDKKQMPTMRVLFRDLHMSLFSIFDKVDNNSPLYTAIESLEFQQFEHLCEKMKNTSPRNSFIQQLKSAYNGDHKGELDNTVLSYIARYGLVCLFHKIRSYVLNLDAPVDKVSGFTMLQIAALYGRLGMVEYLLFSGANIAVQTKQELTAVHLSAIKGNKECTEYLLEYMNCLGLPADANLSQSVSHHHLDAGYGKQVEDFSTVLLPEKDGLEILCTVTAYARSKILLNKKFQELKISSSDGFSSFIRKHRTTFDDSIRELAEEVKSLLTEISRTNPKFRGNLVPLSDNYDLISKDSLQLYYELELNSDKDFHVSYTKKGDVVSASVSFYNPNFTGFCLKEEFCKAVLETLIGYTVKTQNLWMLYPCYTVTEIGVSLYYVWYKNGRTRQMRVMLTPVLKTKFPKHLISQSHHPAVDFLKEIDLVYLASCKEDDWTFILTEVQNQIFSTLRGDQQLVYMACKLIINFLYSCWWFPREHSRRHCHNWHFFSVGLVTLPYRVLMSLFLEEVASAPPEAWEPAMFLDRIISTFKRATDEEEKGRLPRKEIRLLLDPTNTVQKPVNKLICAILEFLENVK
ncbi:uncharacterized protein [Penaeus vannamei]|uniref:uncharacterized protein isoform X2 n=1 Tax=Penaeus vannamei TaxID=6689 RepID=UPI00387F6610